jgi:SHAQKYF class myb-like DNA-binding protein
MFSKENIFAVKNYGKVYKKLHPDNSLLDTNNGRWTHPEHVKFVEAIFMYGNEWKKVKGHINTRSSSQARSHAQKYFLKLRKILTKDSQVGEINSQGINLLMVDNMYNYLKTFLEEYSKDSQSCLNINKYKLMQMLYNFCKISINDKDDTISVKSFKPKRHKKKSNKIFKIVKEKYENNNTKNPLDNYMNMMNNNLLNIPNFICNNIISDNGYHFNTFNFNFFPLSMFNESFNNSIYENLKTLIQQQSNNKPPEVKKDELNNPFSLNFNIDVENHNAPVDKEFSQDNNYYI